jgi:lipoprotein NlpI
LDLAAWPGPIVKFYLGDITRDDLLHLAQTSDPKETADQTCQANFYLAEWSLLQGQRTAAIDLLRKARDGCPKNLDESTYARSELARLEKSP